MLAWLAAARAKHASLSGDAMQLFAAVASNPDTLPSADGQWDYRELTLQGAASSWSATDGYLEDDFIGFADKAYAYMRDDETRTPLFAEAISSRLAEAPPQTLTILDIGTGPHAVLALLAAEKGARKVYAIEVNEDAAKRARETIEQAGYSDVIQVIDGFSTQIELPEQVDVVVSEIVGSIASEEGLYATIKDAHRRFVKEPTRQDSWIPHRVETWAAPCSYALQYALTDPSYDWGGIDEPLRLSCVEDTLLQLADPQRMEVISFTNPDLPPVSRTTPPPLDEDGLPLPDGPPPVDSVFEITGERLESNEESYYSALLKEGVDEQGARQAARGAARSLAGIGMWPRLILRGSGQPGEPNEADNIVVESRGIGSRASWKTGSRTSWQTVLPLLDTRPVTIAPGQVVRTRSSVELPRNIDQPVWYSLEYW